MEALEQLGGGMLCLIVCVVMFLIVCALFWMDGRASEKRIKEFFRS